MANMNKTKRLAFMALLTAMALTIFVLEAQIPAPGGLVSGQRIADRIHSIVKSFSVRK